MVLLARLRSSRSLLLLDEPSAGLTREEREDLAHFILKTKEELGIPIIWIEHDMQMVADIADRILVLDVGRIIADGPPQTVLRDPGGDSRLCGRELIEQAECGYTGSVECSNDA